MQKQTARMKINSKGEWAELNGSYGHNQADQVSSLGLSNGREYYQVSCLSMIYCLFCMICFSSEKKVR